jgi:pantothenate kinase-related protein Tda10
MITFLFLGIQGPPGTGKSFTLSVIADILYSNKSMCYCIAYPSNGKQLFRCNSSTKPWNQVSQKELKIRDLPSSVQTMSFYGVHFKKTKK